MATLRDTHSRVVGTAKIVLPLLGLDFGYGVERGDYEIYLAIGLTD